MSNIVLDRRGRWLTNLRWSLKDVADITERVAAGWDNASLAEAYLVDEETMVDMLERNGIRRRRPVA